MTIGKAFGAGDPINLVDEEGERPRIYIQNGGFGHAFITTGEGVKTTVYSYGRYGALDRYSGKTSGQSTPSGEGVLRILKGKDAATYLNKVFDEGGFSVFECFKGDDALIDAFFEEKFKNGSDPSNPLKETYNNPNSRAINRYSLLFRIV